MCSVDPEICAFCLQQQPGFGHIASSSYCLCHLQQTYLQPNKKEVCMDEDNDNKKNDEDGDYECETNKKEKSEVETGANACITQ